MTLLALLLSFILHAEEKAPIAEYPYPQRSVSSEEGWEKPIKKDHTGVYYYNTKKGEKKKRSLEGVEKPYKIGSDGTYYYTDDKTDDEKLKSHKGVEEPIDRDSGGGYYYSRQRKQKTPKVQHGPRPSKVTKSGEYYYDLDSHQTTNTLSLRGGVMASPDFKGRSEGASYKDLYGDSSSFLLAVDYDWRLAGGLFLKAGSGLTVSDGQGQFATPQPGGITPKESFQFFIFPNTVSLAYKAQIWDIQWLTPYLEAGAGYFTFVEARSDGGLFSFDGTSKYGGAFVGTATAGVLISLSRWTRGTALLSDYGASQAWLDIQFRQNLGLDSRKDFTSNMITGGLALGF